MAGSGYLYFPGCSLKSQGAAYESSLLALFRALDLPLVELDDWNCCGATSYMSIEERSAFALSARNILIACQAGGRDIVAPCSACYLALRKTQDYCSQYPDIEAEMGAAAGNGAHRLSSVRVRHPLEVLWTDVGLARIKEKVSRRWEGGPVACYYGCQAVRPFHEVDRPHNPMRMDELMGAAGIPTVDYALKTKCCGGSLTGTIHEVGVRLNYILLKEAVRKGARAIVTICPLCQFNLDVYQKEMRGEDQERYDIPVLYFSQLLGWAVGLDPGELGFDKSIAGRKFIRERLLVSREAVAHV